MNAEPKPREFPLPSSVKVVPGTERAQAAHPYHIQFSKADDQKLWFYNFMPFPEPMSAFDMVTAEAAYCATPDRWITDFREAGFKPEVYDLILKDNAIAAIGLAD